MKKIAIIPTILTGIFVLAAISLANGGNLTTYYDNYLSMKIKHCKRVVSDLNSCYNSSMEKLVEMRAAQAEFYQKNKPKLIQMMDSKKIGNQPHKIDYFLITRFKGRKHLAKGR